METTMHPSVLRRQARLMNSKARCTFCKEYFPAEELRRAGLAGVCSETCLAGLVQKSRDKRARREKTKERKKNSPRLGGTTRKKVRERDLHVCSWCGVRPLRGEVHHIIYRSQGGKDTMHNLILLCDEHHRMAHSNKRLWQPVLLAYIWIYYAEDKRLLIPEVLRRLVEHGGHPDPELAGKKLAELRFRKAA